MTILLLPAGLFFGLFIVGHFVESGLREVARAIRERPISTCNCAGADEEDDEEECCA